MSNYKNEFKVHTNQFYIQLDGLRGIAIMEVILYHYFPYVTIFSFGWSGVDLFFVLSGYLITGRLFPFLLQSNLLFKFYRNRILRIVPLYFCFLILFFFFWFIIIAPHSSDIGAFYNQNWWTFFLFLQNWTYIMHLNHSADYIRHFWSLAVEEQFYFLFPFFIIWVEKAKWICAISILLIILIVITRSLYFFSHFSNIEYEYINWNTFFRFDSFLIGTILYFFINYSKRSAKAVAVYKYISLACFVSLLFVFFYYRNGSLFNAFFSTIGYTVIGVLFSYVIFISISATSVHLNNILLQPALTRIGKISYGMYIFHLPIYLFGFGIVNKMFHLFSLEFSVDSIHLINAGFSFLLTFILSNLSYKYFESFFLKWKLKA